MDKDKLSKAFLKILESWANKNSKLLLKGENLLKVSESLFWELANLFKEYGNSELFDSMKERERIGFKMAKELENISDLNKRIEIVRNVLQQAFL